MIKRMGAAVLTVAVLVGGAGCSGSDADESTEPVASTPAEAPTVATPSASASASADATAAPSDAPPESTVGLVECMSGSYELARFVSLGGDSTYGTGEGGDVTFTTDGATWAIQGEGTDPMALTLAGQKGTLAVDGAALGTLTTSGYVGTFTLTDATGSAILQSGPQKQTVPMKQVAAVVAPNGKAQLTCTEGKLTMLFPQIRLEFERP